MIKNKTKIGREISYKNRKKFSLRNEPEIFRV